MNTASVAKLVACHRLVYWPLGGICG